MKRLLILTFLAAHVLGAGTGIAQEITITGIRPENFSGVKIAPNSDRYYVAFMDATAQDSANVMLKVFDQGMQPRLDVGIPMAKGTELAASAYTGQFYILQLVNLGNKTRTTLAIDEAGNVFRRKDETDIKATALAPAAFPAFYPVGMNEVLSLRTSRDGKPVVEFELMDTEFGSRWKKTLDNETPAELVALKTELDRVYLIKKQKDGTKVSYAIQSLSGMTGDVFFTTDLREGGRTAMPSYLEVQHSFVTVAGVFQNEPGAGGADGIFYARVSPTGMLEKMQFLPWPLIKSQIKNAPVAELESGKSGLLIQSAIADNNDEGVTLIGELYKKTPGTEANTAKFAVQDFVLIHFDKEGQVDRFSQIDKPEKELVINGSMSAKTDIDLAQWLNKNNFFAYRAAVPVAGNKVITYLNNNNGKGTAYFATIDSTGKVSKESIGSVSLDRPAEETSGKNKDRDRAGATADKAILNSTEKDLRDFALAEAKMNIFPVTEGHVMIYNYTEPDLRFWIVPVQVR
ncbi:MAG: hypothetical protein K0R82_52 [Flavipsychrobacter sp.]|jgi:hypothetical protein|nr:hypothetical protein [Flavipsychrobacter sp.]